MADQPKFVPRTFQEVIDLLALLENTLIALGLSPVLDSAAPDSAAFFRVDHAKSMTIQINLNSLNPGVRLHVINGLPSNSTTVSNICDFFCSIPGTNDEYYICADLDKTCMRAGCVLGMNCDEIRVEDPKTTSKLDQKAVEIFDKIKAILNEFGVDIDQ